jgi:hypothetical protein
MAKTDYQKRREFERDNTWLMQIVSQIQSREFYGKLSITFEKGRTQRVLKEESLKPPV